MKGKNTRVLVFFYFFLFFSIFLFSAVDVKADLLGWEKADKAATKFAGYEASDDTTFSSNIGSLIQAVLSMLGVVFLILMAYAGYLWMTARGEEEQVTKAHEIIIAAIIGIIVVGAAYSITTFVVPKILDKTGGTSGEGDVGALATGCCVICETGNNLISFGDPAVFEPETTQAYCDEYCDGKSECEASWWQNLYKGCHGGAGTFNPNVNQSCEKSCKDGKCFN